MEENTQYIAEMGMFWSFFLLFLLVIATAIVGSRLIKNFRIHRIISETPTMPIQSAPQGYVELKGHFEKEKGKESMTAPFSNEQCLWYEVKIEKKYEDDDGDKWKTVFTERSPHPIILNDGTGQCVIFPCSSDGNLNLHESKFGDNDMRYTEKVIKEGDKAYAIGQFKTIEPIQESESSESEEEAVPHVLQLIKNWRTDYMESLHGYPKQTEANVVDDVSRVAGWGASALEEVCARWVSSDGPINMMLPDEDSRRYMYVSCGEEKDALGAVFKNALVYGGVFFVLSIASIVHFVLLMFYLFQ